MHFLLILFVALNAHISLSLCLELKLESCLGCVNNGRIYCYSKDEASGCWNDIIPELRTRCEVLIGSISECEELGKMGGLILERSIHIKPADFSSKSLSINDIGSNNAFPDNLEDHEICKIRFAHCNEERGHVQLQLSIMEEKLQKSSMSNEQSLEQIRKQNTQVSSLQSEVLGLIQEKKRKDIDSAKCQLELQNTNTAKTQLQGVVGQKNDELIGLQIDIKSKDEEIHNCATRLTMATDLLNISQDMSVFKGQFKACVEAITAYLHETDFSQKEVGDLPESESLLDVCQSNKSMSFYFSEIRIALVVYLVTSLKWLVIFCIFRCKMFHRRNNSAVMTDIPLESYISYPQNSVQVRQDTPPHNVVMPDVGESRDDNSDNGYSLPYSSSFDSVNHYEEIND